MSTRSAVDAPVFILGNHRSGTTWLYSLLAETGLVDYLATDQVIAYDRLDDPAARQAVATELARLGVTRRIDDVAVGPATPEEYRFVLENRGTGAWLSRRNLPLFDEMCQRVRRDSGGGRPLLLKNPLDYSNLRYLSEAVPGARFIFLHRHPERVISSSLVAARGVFARRDAHFALISREYRRLWARPLALMLARAGATGRLDVGVRVATLVVADANGQYLRNVGRLPSERCLSIRYEDLCADPARWLGRALALCGLDPAAARAAQPARPRRGELLPEVVRWRPVIGRVMARYMALHGYRPGEVSDRVAWRPC